MVNPREVDEFLSERPDLVAATERLLETDGEFTFDDLDIDSGSFGELVARGIVERDGDTYTVADREAVRRALDGDVAPEPETREWFETDALRARVDWTVVAVLVGVAVLAILLRTLSLPAVFRGGDVVLTGNDPYYYRYWVEELLRTGRDPLALPDTLAHNEPLLFLTLLAGTLLAGGTVESAGFVLAWYPVVAGVLGVVLVYGITTVTTRDRRIGVAAALLLAVTPGHAFRTSLGFADHHAFDYAWLAVTLFGAALLAARRDHGRRRLAAGSVTVAVGVVGQTLAWNAGPLFLVPLGIYGAVESIRSVGSPDSALARSRGLLTGVAAAAVVTFVIHTTLGWQSTLVASTPLALAIGLSFVAVTSDVVDTLDLPSVVAFVVASVSVSAAGLGVRRLTPDIWRRITTSVERSLFRSGNIAEVGGLFGQSFGWLLLFGFVGLLAAPYLVFGTVRLRERHEWAPTVFYGWYVLGLAAIQVRFAGQLGLLTAVFAGVGFVHLAERVELVRRPVPLATEVTRIDSLAFPDASTVGYLCLLFLLVSSLGVVQTSVKTSQITVPESQYETATWMESYEASFDREYPRNYVFSQWGDNRLYNYFVNGESKSYTYAQVKYENFVTGTDPVEWYRTLRPRTGYVVTTPAVVGDPSWIGTRLHGANGSRTASTDAVAHYRLVHTSRDDRYKVFTLVQGAELEGEVVDNDSIKLTTTVTLDTTTFEYTRLVEPSGGGEFTILVAYPGEYTIGNRTVTVTESAVRNGTTVQINGTIGYTNRSTVVSESAPD